MRSHSSSDRLGWTQRRLQQVFQAEVGLTPRAYQRLQRFRATLASIDAAAEVGWAAFALEHGYLRLREPALNHVPG